MRIGIDCRLGGLTHAGIGRYCEQLVYNVVQLNSPHTWVLFFFDSQQIKSSEYFTQIAQAQNVEIRFTPIKHYTLAEQCILPLHFYREKLDLLHVPHFNVPLAYRKPFVVTIHDLLWHQYLGTKVTTLPTMFYWIKYLGYLTISKQAISGSRKIFVPTQTVKKDVVGKFIKSKNKIIVTHEGVDVHKLTVVATTSSKNTQNTNDVTVAPILRQLQKNHKKYLLYVGSLYPHKNIQVVLRALKEFPDLNLCIVGSRSVFQDVVKKQVTELKIPSQVFFAGFQPDRALGILYTHALAVVQPSLSEGFGLTGIEAMAMNTPVLASDIPIFRELYKDHAQLFDPHSVSALVSTIKKIQTMNKEEVNLMTKKAKEYVSRFNWKKMAQETLLGYQDSL